MQTDKVRLASSVGERIRATRLIYELGQKHVAEKLGCSKVTICRYEEGKRQMEYDVMLRFASAFGVDANWLLHGYLAGVSPPVQRSLEAIAAEHVRTPPSPHAVVLQAVPEPRVQDGRVRRGPALRRQRAMAAAQP